MCGYTKVPGAIICNSKKTKKKVSNIKSRIPQSMDIPQSWIRSLSPWTTN